MVVRFDAHCLSLDLCGSTLPQECDVNSRIIPYLHFLSKAARTDQLFSRDHVVNERHGACLCGDNKWDGRPVLQLQCDVDRTINSRAKSVDGDLGMPKWKAAFHQLISNPRA